MVKVSVLDIAKGLGLSVSTVKNRLRDAGIGMSHCDGEMLVRFLAVYEGGFDGRDLRRMRDENKARCREIRELRRNRKKRPVPVQFLGPVAARHDDGYVDDVEFVPDEDYQTLDFE